MNESREYFNSISTDETRRIEFNGKKYCAYCGKEIKEDYDIIGDDYTNPRYHYICDCEDAKKELNIKYQIHFLEREWPQAKFKIEPQLIKK